MNRTVTIGMGGVVAALCGSAWGATTTFTASSGNWSASGNWSNGVPTEADRAVIPSGKTCNVDISNAVADTIEVQESGGTPGVLNIQAGQKLTLDNDNDNCCGAGTPDHSVVNGQVVIQWSSGSGGGVLKIDENDHEVTGSGRIQGDNVASKIQIASGRTLTNQLITGGEGIRGKLTIEGSGGDGAFYNSGLLEAADGSIVLASSTILDDDTDAIWGLRCFSDMTFDRTATSLVGHFRNFSTTEHGEFIFNATVQTCGTYTRNYGGITINGNAAFRYLTFAGGQTGCGNPGTTTGPNPECTPGYNEQVFQVSSTAASCVTCDS